MASASSSSLSEERETRRDQRSGQDDEDSSELSSLTDEEEESEDEEEEDSEDEVGARFQPSILRDVSKVTITPHHRSEKHGGRPTRKTAANASSAWSRLTPRAYRMRSQDSSDEDDEDESVADSLTKRVFKRTEETADVTATPSKARFEATSADVTPKRKRGRPRKDESSRPPAADTTSVEGTPKRKRGRPRKDESTAMGAANRTPKRKRGRPRKDESTGFVAVQGPADLTPKRKRGRPRKDEQILRSGGTAYLATGKEGLTIADEDVFAGALGESLIQPTSYDAYFLNHSARRTGLFAQGKTSDNLLTDDYPALTAKTVLSLSKRLTKEVQDSLDGDTDGAGQIPSVMSLAAFERFYDHWWALLSMLDRPLLFYGVGSKKAVLQHFARQMAEEGRCSAIVVRGYAGSRIEDVVSQLERQCSVSPIADVSKAQRMRYSMPLEARAHHVVRVLAGEERRFGSTDHLPPSFLILVHGIDSPALLQEKSLRILAILSKSPKVHMCADTAHVNAAMLSGMDNAALYRDRLNWLWIDLTTFVPILDEIIAEKGTALNRNLGLPPATDIRRAGAGSDATALAIEYRPLTGHASSAGGAATVNGGELQLLSDRAAVHILRSVTYKARGMFLLLASRLMRASDPASSTKTSLSTMPYADLVDLARNNFLAMTPDALRALLVEFTTHGLISTQDNTVHVALSKSDLQSVVSTFSSGS